MRFWSWLFLGLLLSVPGSALAQSKKKAEPIPPMEFAPQNLKLYSRTDLQLLSFDCEGDPPFNTMTCRTFTVMIRPPAQEAHTDLLKKRLDYIRSGQWAKERGKLCKNMPEIRKDLAQNPDQNGLRRAYAIRDTLGFLAWACDCKTAECAEAEVQRVMAEAQPPCTLTTMALNSFEYRRVGPNTWTYQLSGGMCSTVVTTGVLQRLSEWRWSFVQTRTGSVDPNNVLCNNLELGKAAEYSSDYYQGALLQCSSIDFE